MISEQKGKKLTAPGTQFDTPSLFILAFHMKLNQIKPFLISRTRPIYSTQQSKQYNHFFPSPLLTSKDRGSFIGEICRSVGFPDAELRTLAMIR